MLGTALIEGSRTIVWARGAQSIKQNVLFWVTAWQAVGGSAAMTIGAARYLVKQLEELASNPDRQPAYIQWTASAAAGAFNRADEHDGWYVIDDVQANYLKFIGAGIVECRMTVSLIAPAAPASLALRWAGGPLASTYTATPLPLLGYPIGSSGQVSGAFSRAGAEGSIPLSSLPAASSVNPLPFVRPNTVAALFTGGVRVYDSINTSSNPVPVAGAFVNASWVEVFGTQHDFAGDCIVTNGLLLLLFQVGQAGSPRVYAWNTSLGPPAWQNVGDVTYFDSALNAGTLREVNLDRVGLEEVRVRATASTSAGNWARLVVRLARGRMDAPIEFWPLTQNSSVGSGLSFATQASQKIIYTEGSVADAATNPNATQTPSAANGFCAAFGQGVNGPICGWLYQNAPSPSQGQLGLFSLLSGDATGPALGSFRLYSIFVVPFLAAPNLQAEAESGALGTGWSSVVDAAASAGNTAKAASGTLTANADLFGTAWVPPGGTYDVWFRAKVTSAASALAQMTLGLWDVTAAAFVANASTTYAPNQWTTGFTWLKVSVGAVQPIAAHNVQFRAVTAATLATDWFIDEAALTPRVSNTLGLGNFPADLFSAFLFDLERRWVRG